jgi:prepilin-type N-terminal cleavage/methylation domain-containing protein
MIAPSRHRGFTLLEVLIASLLASGLMLGLWGLLGIYSRLFESGKAATEQSQLARAIVDQLADDLRAAIQDSTAKPKPAAVGSGFEMAAATRRFSLVGSRRGLRLDVLQIMPEQAFPPPEDKATPDEDQAKTAQTPELRTIEYTFVDPATGSEDDATKETDGDSVDLRPGLTRRELDFETPDPRRKDAREKPSSSLKADIGKSDGNGNLTDDDLAQEDVDDPSTTSMPEVVGLEFRYFDGRGWSSEWDSLLRGSLPVAVEARIEIESFDPRDLRRRLADEGALNTEVKTVGSERPDVVESDTIDDDAPVASARGRRVYRLIVDMPGAAKYRGIKAESDEADKTVEPNVRAFAPQPQRKIDSPSPESWRLETPKAAPSDQWMRIDAQ